MANFKVGDLVMLRPERVGDCWFYGEYAGLIGEVASVMPVRTWWDGATDEASYGVTWPKTEQCRGGYVSWFHEAALVTPLSEEG